MQSFSSSLLTQSGNSWWRNERELSIAAGSSRGPSSEGEIAALATLRRGGFRELFRQEYYAVDIQSSGKYGPRSARKNRMRGMLEMIRYGCSCVMAAMLMLLAVAAQAADPPRQACVLIDTDFDIDDMMAIPLVIANRHVAAIVTTEGATTAPLAASALARLLAAPGLDAPVPVIIGGVQGRDLKPWPWLPPVRGRMERTNDLLTVAMPPKPPAHPFEADVAKALHDCTSVSILAIGPFTSFVRYSPAIRDRIDLVVLQGRPLHSPEEGTNARTFNCIYDQTACETAFRQLQGLHPVWVDVPKQAADPYSPTLDMVQGLRNDGLPGALRAALLSLQETWRMESQSAGHSFLWDQLAALYLLHPGEFHRVGAHMEPVPAAADIRRQWTADTNGP
jgi:inosine-uridine nucleoside N-ribohydrolase